MSWTLREQPGRGIVRVVNREGAVGIGCRNNSAGVIPRHAERGTGIARRRNPPLAVISQLEIARIRDPVQGVIREIQVRPAGILEPGRVAGRIPGNGKLVAGRIGHLAHPAPGVVPVLAGPVERICARQQPSHRTPSERSSPGNSRR